MGGGPSSKRRGDADAGPSTPVRQDSQPSMVRLTYGGSRGHSVPLSSAPSRTKSVSGKGKLQCRFCGGRLCPFENYRRQKKTEPAVEGLNSSWVTSNIIAMQRPSERLIKEFGICEQFARAGVKAILNLQEVGEHPVCGDGIVESGFSYYPETFMDRGIFFYNFGWQDMGAPTSMDLVMDIVQVMSFTIEDQGGKIAIHCHAGLGRTGMVIAAYLVYQHRFSPDEAIGFVRKYRPGAIQTGKQIEFLRTFSYYLESLRTVYCHPPMFPRISIVEALRYQRRYLHGVEALVTRNIPRIVDELCRKLEEMSQGGVGAGEVLGAFGPDRLGQFQDSDRVRNIKEGVNLDAWGHLSQEQSPCVVAALLVEWFQQLREPVMNTAVIDGMIEAAAGAGTEEDRVRQAGRYLADKDGAAAWTVRRVVMCMRKVTENVPGEVDGVLRTACVTLGSALLQCAEDLDNGIELSKVLAPHRLVARRRSQLALERRRSTLSVGSSDERPGTPELGQSSSQKITGWARPERGQVLAAAEFLFGAVRGMEEVVDKADRLRGESSELLKRRHSRRSSLYRDPAPASPVASNAIKNAELSQQDMQKALPSIERLTLQSSTRVRSLPDLFNPNSPNGPPRSPNEHLTTRA